MLGWSGLHHPSSHCLDMGALGLAGMGLLDVCLSILNSQEYAPAAAGVAGLDAPANAGLKLTAHTLVGLATQLGLRLATFSLGPAARLLGAQSHMCLCMQGAQQRMYS